jgi:hypothetical protein
MPRAFFIRSRVGEARLVRIAWIVPDCGGYKIASVQTEATMSHELNPEAEFRLRQLANEFLLQAAFIRLMLLDPGFARDARQWFDTLFGKLSALGTDDPLDPQLTSVLREEYLRRLTLIETQARIVATPTSVPKPKSIRRSIFEWFERG